MSLKQLKRLPPEAKSLTVMEFARLCRLAGLYRRAYCAIRKEVKK